MNRHHRPRWPLITTADLRHHGLEIQVLGWLTLFVAMLCWLLIDPPAGVILGIVLTVLGVVKIVLGLHWRRNAER